MQYRTGAQKVRPAKRTRSTVALVVAAALVGGGIAALPNFAKAADPTYTSSVRSLDTGVRSGYQLALDAESRRVYVADAQWSTSTVPVAVEGETRSYGEQTFNVGSGKLSVFDAATDARLADHDFLGLSRNDGTGTDSTPYATDKETLDALAPNAQGVISRSSMRTTFSPYGVAVDGKTPGGATIVTTTARGQGAYAGFGYGGNIVVYSASQGAPTDADRIFAYDDEAETPVFDGPRRIAVDTQRHLAYVTNLGTGRGNQSGADARPGSVTVLDLTKRGLDAVVAQVALPLKGDRAIGAVGVTVDEGNNKIYIGTIGNGENLFVVDGSKIVKSNPRTTDKATSQVQNAAAVTELTQAPVGDNARPTYNAELKRVYVSDYETAGTITVVDADPASADYGKVIDTIATGATNAVEVDGERGLLYSANLGDREVVVYDTDTHEKLLSVPTSGNAVNIVIDPVTRDAWVSNFAATGKVDVISIKEEVSKEPSITVPATWTVGEKLTVKGSGWFTKDDLGSTIAVKLGANDTPLTNAPEGQGYGIWKIVKAADNGTFEAELDFPNADLTTNPWPVGKEGTIYFLSGSLGENDISRSKNAKVTVVAAPEPSTPPAVAKVEVPEKWTVDQPLSVSGTGWVTADGTGSTIAVKLNRGGTAPSTALGGDAPDDVWAVIDAAADGSWNVELAFPNAARTASPWTAGSGYTISFLSGSLGENDISRGQTYDIEVVADPIDPSPQPTVEPSEEPTEQPSVEPSEEPTEQPSVEPSEEPTEQPSVEPSEEPTVAPTQAPTSAPTSGPIDSGEPSATPAQSSNPVVDPSSPAVQPRPGLPKTGA